MPCKPSTSTVDTTTTVETTTTETSSATVSESLTESLTSLGSTETMDANSLSTSAETSRALGTFTALLIATTEEPASSAAASATATTVAAAAAVECTTDADCDGTTPFYDAGTCVATDPNVECSTNPDCNALHEGDAPFCFAVGNCVGCRGDGDCYGETPYCDNDFCTDYVGLGRGRL